MHRQAPVTNSNSANERVLRTRSVTVMTPQSRPFYMSPTVSTEGRFIPARSLKPMSMKEPVWRISFRVGPP